MWFPPLMAIFNFMVGPPQVIHRMVIQPFLPEFEAALHLTLDHVTILW